MRSTVDREVRVPKARMTAECDRALGAAGDARRRAGTTSGTARGGFATEGAAGRRAQWLSMQHVMSLLGHGSFGSHRARVGAPVSHTPKAAARAAIRTSPRNDIRAMPGCRA